MLILGIADSQCWGLREVRNASSDGSARLPIVFIGYRLSAILRPRRSVLWHGGIDLFSPGRNSAFQIVKLTKTGFL
jgi:hypothetical protein